MKKWIVVCAFMIPFNAHADEPQTVTSGSCAKNANSTCAWSFDTSTGTLTISGQGAMANYDYFMTEEYDRTSDGHVMPITPWNVQNDDGTYPITEIKNIVIGKDITSIGNRAFAHATNLTNVTFEEGSQLQTIGEHAFALTGLTNITFPDSVTTLGSSSLQFTDLATWNWPANLTKIGWATFNHNNAIESIVIPDSVTSIGNQAFTSCPNLKSIILGENVTSVGNVAWNNNVYIYCEEKGHGGKSCEELVSAAGRGKLRTYTVENGKIKVGSKTYNSFDELPGYVLRRIYTVEEAEAAAGPVNRVTIRYK